MIANPANTIAAAMVTNRMPRHPFLPSANRLSFKLRTRIKVHARSTRLSTTGRSGRKSRQVRFFPRQSGYPVHRRRRRSSEAARGTTEQDFTRSEDQQRERERHDVIKEAKQEQAG